MEGGDLKFHIYNMGGEPGFPEERSRSDHHFITDIKIFVIFNTIITDNT